MEKHMRELSKNTDNREYSALMLAYFFWQVADYIAHSNRADIFRYLYLTSNHLNENYLKISLKFNVTVRTLERYRKTYVISFKATKLLLNTYVILFKAA